MVMVDPNVVHVFRRANCLQASSISPRHLRGVKCYLPGFFFFFCYFRCQMQGMSSLSGEFSTHKGIGRACRFDCCFRRRKLRPDLTMRSEPGFLRELGRRKKKQKKTSSWGGMGVRVCVCGSSIEGGDRRCGRSLVAVAPSLPGSCSGDGVEDFFY